MTLNSSLSAVDYIVLYVVYGSFTAIIKLYIILQTSDHIYERSHGEFIINIQCCLI